MEHRTRAHQELANARRQRGRNHKGNEGAPAKFKQKKLDRQDDSGNRSIECRGHAGARAAGQQDFALRGSGRNQLADERTERSAGLNDRSLGAERAAGANRDGRRDGLEDRDFSFDAALGSENRLHRFRDAVPLNFRRAILRHEPDDDSANDRNDDHPRAELIIRRTAKMEGPYMVEREIREQSDQVVEKKGNDSSDDAHERRPAEKCSRDGTELETGRDRELYSPENWNSKFRLPVLGHHTATSRIE